MTASYIVRAVSTPELINRQIIWIASLVVQGGWLVLVGLPDLVTGRPNLLNLWWAFATVASGIALATERNSPVVAGRRGWNRGRLPDQAA